ncbi:MAG: hypothetical protein LBU65_05050 [Planctomycetaceae bacterium]|nr:hypothetical protein [Planctomycetaceae bacterium]
MNVLLLTNAAACFGAVPADQIFPDTTKGFFSITSVRQLGDQWKKTQIGKLMYDDVMSSFVADAQRQFRERLNKRFGIVFDGIEKLPTGELAAGMVVIPEVVTGFVLTLDVTGQEDNTKDFLSHLGEKLIKLGAKSDEVNANGKTITKLTFPGANETEPTRYAYYLLQDSTLIIADQQQLCELLAARVAAKEPENPLADSPNYVTVRKRIDADLPKELAAADSDDLNEPIIRWYIDPLGYGKAITMLLPKPEKRKDKPSIFDVLAEQGFDAILGAGGSVSIKAENFEVVHRSYIHAPKPHRLAMRMLAFPNGKEFDPPKWLPRDLASTMMLYVDALSIFDNFGTLFDSLILEEKGAWQSILDGLEKDTNGPQINVRKELVELLGTRVTSMSKYAVPITTQSESLMVAIQLKPGTEDAAKKALEKLFQGDPEIQRSVYKGLVIWQNRVPKEEEMINPEDLGGGLPAVDFGPATTPAEVKPKKKVVEDEDDEDEKERPPFFPRGGVTVANGCIMAGTDVEYMLEIFDRLKSPKDSITDSTDYKIVKIAFDELGVTKTPHFIQSFARTDETIRPTYEMIREGKMPESQALLGRIVNLLFASPDQPKGSFRKQQIDGSKMPEFELIRRHFGPSGLYGVTEDDGWFIKGFLLEK